jgi:hypothetical protein
MENTAIGDKVIPVVQQNLHLIGGTNDPRSKLSYIRLTISRILRSPSLIDLFIDQLLSFIQPNSSIIEAVAVCQEMQRLANLNDPNWKSTLPRIFQALILARSKGQSTLQSATSVTLFELFNLGERSSKELQELAKTAPPADATLQLLQNVITQVQSDRQKMKIIR